MIWHEFDVVIVGFGPVGATAANLMGHYGIKTAVVEKETDIYSGSRAAHLDDEVMRVFQALGLHEKLATVMRPVPGMQFLGKKREVLFELQRHNPDDHINGFTPSNMFYQPDVERVLREALEQYPHVEVFSGHEVQTITPAPDNILVKSVETATGSPVFFTGQFVFACDGAESSIRSKAGFQMENHHFDQSWLIIDAVLKGNVQLPDTVQEICDPKRPSAFVPLPGKRCRWEFLLLDEERPDDMERPQRVRELLSGWGIDPDQLEIERSSVYRFRAKFAKQWYRNRIFLLGDAAHQLPPFLGQGLCAGIRDAHNLAWKLNLVFKGVANAKLLNTYGQERKPHIEEVINIGVGFGSILEASNPLMAILRDGMFSRLHKVAEEGGGEALEMPDLTTGYLGGESEEAAGRFFIQPRLHVAGEGDHMLDDIIGEGFAVIGLNADPEEVTRSNASFWAKIDAKLIYIVPKGHRAQEVGGHVVTVHDEKGKIAEWLKPYEAADYVILRPDRYVFGVFSQRDAAKAGKEVERLMGKDAGEERVMNKKSKKGIVEMGVSALGAGLALLKMWTRDELD